MSEAELVATLSALPNVKSVRHGPACVRVDLTRLDPEALTAAVAALGLRLGAVTGTPLATRGETEIVYHFVALDRIVDIGLVTQGNTAPSLAPHLRPAAWAEREIHDLFDVAFPGHPDLAPLMRPEGYVTGMMREPMCGARRPVAPDPSE